MRDHLLDLVEHTHDLGVIDLVKITGDDKYGVVRQSSIEAGVIMDIGRTLRIHVVGPQADLIVVASAIPVFRAVKYRWGRVADKKVDGLGIDGHLDIPVVLGT